MNEKLGSYLKEQILAERLCGARMTKILDSTLLSERDAADLESLIADERNHAGWLSYHATAARYPKPDGYPGTWAETIYEHHGLLQDLTPEQMAVSVYIPERYAVRTINRQAELFDQAGDHIGADLYRQILGEERRHVDVMGRLVRSFLGSDQDGRVRDFYSRAINRGFRQFHMDFLRGRA